MDSICYCLNEILVSFILASIYRAIFSCSYPLHFLVHFFIAFCFFGFHANFFSFSVILSYYSFSICYMFYLHFWRTLFSKQWSVNVGEREVGSVSSIGCSNVLFASFEQVIFCWRSITLDYRGFLLFF